jgi:DNA-binding response OmpR family regulator
MTKPFSFEELLARVRAQLRSPSQRESSALEVAGIAMDLRTRRVRRDGRNVQLTAREFEVLEYLMRHPDQVLSRAQVLNAVWGFDFDPGTKVLEVYIGYLRRKLGEPRGDDPIETVRNVGYRLRVACG